MDRTSPLFSIIITTYDRPRQLAAALEAVAAQEYPPDGFEVIVVDDGGRIPAEPVVALFVDRLGIRLLRQERAGPAAARNLGAARARGAFLAFTDDDCMPAPNWLSALAVRFAENPDRIIGGKTVNALPDNLCSAASQLLVDYLCAYYNEDVSRARFLASSNLALPAALFHDLRGFDQKAFLRAAGEDRDLCARGFQQGRPMTYDPEVEVYHAHDLTFGGFLRQHFNYGRGAFRFRKIAAGRKERALRIEPLSFYVHLLRYPVSRERGARKIRIQLLFGLMQLFNAAGFLSEALRSRRGPAGAAPLDEKGH